MNKLTWIFFALVEIKVNSLLGLAVHSILLHYDHSKIALYHEIFLQCWTTGLK